MKILKTALQLVSLTAIASAAFGVSARAADLPTRKEPPSLYTPAPAYNWGGAYVGINGGYGFGQQNPLAVITNKYDNASFDISGGAIGGTAGLQLQQGHVVLGVEGDIDWADISGSHTVIPSIGGAAQPFQLTLKSDINWISTGRVRYGYAVDNWLFYGTAGLALMGNQPHAGNLTYTRTGASLTCADAALPNCNASDLSGGFAFGTGIEYGFAANWSAKAEYLYIAQIQGANTQNLNLFRVGLNYRFGG